MNTIQYLPEAVHYMQQVGPPASSTQTHLDRFSRFFHGSLGDRQSDRPRYSVSNSRQSAQWSSQILILFVATTSIYWSS